MKYIRSLDGLRFVAIALVIVYHFYESVFSIGWIGVQVFFTLSGYLITQILLESKAQFSLTKYLKRFYWRRLIRIFPLYYFFLLLVLAIFLITNKPDSFKNSWLLLITYTYNFKKFLHLQESDSIDVIFSHFWSLSIEEQFYLFWPLTIFFLNTKRLKFLVLLIIFSSPAIRYFTFNYLDGNFDLDSIRIGKLIYKSTFCQLDAFMFGAVIPIFRLDKVIIHKNVTLSFYFLMTILSLIFVASIKYDSLENIISWKIFLINTGSTTANLHLWIYTLLGGFSMLLITSLTSTKSFLSKLLETRFLVHIGQISYGLYVYHFPLNNLFTRISNLGYDKELCFVVYLIVLYIISRLSYDLFEKRLLVYK